MGVFENILYERVATRDFKTRRKFQQYHDRSIRKKEQLAVAVVKGKIKRYENEAKIVNKVR